jgi:hypothetical protein
MHTKTHAPNKHAPSRGGLAKYCTCAQ